MKPKFIIIILLLMAVLSAFLFLSYSKDEKILHVTFLDVGQGDSVLIQSPYGQNILIDGGPDSTVLRRLSEKMPWWDRRIDLLVLTHPHDDHVSGLIEVIRRYDVRKIAYTGVSHTGPNYLAWLDEIKKKDIPVAIIDRPQTIAFGPDCKLVIVWPETGVAGETVANLNDTSIVARLIYQDTSFMLTGDAEETTEKALLKLPDLKSDILKISHHGSDNANSDDFLAAVDPEIFVISVGKGNDFGHPSLRTIKKMERAGRTVYRTDIDGNVAIASDGKRVWKQ